MPSSVQNQQRRFAFETTFDSDEVMNSFACRFRTISNSSGTLLSLLHGNSRSNELAFVEMFTHILPPDCTVEYQRCPIEAILNFHSSIAFNVLTPYFAICFYPLETLEEYENVVFDNGQTDSDDYKNAVSRYEQEGRFRYNHPSVSTMMNKRGGFSSVRAVGDKLCFIIGRPLHQFVPDLEYISKLCTHAYRHVPDPEDEDLSRAMKISYEYVESWEGRIPIGFCLPDEEFMWGIGNTVSLFVLFCISRRAYTELHVAQHTEIPQCLASKWILEQFLIHEPLKGLACLLVAKYLYPYYTYFRYKPQLKLIFNVSTEERARGLFLKVVVLGLPEGAWQCDLAVFDLTEFTLYECPTSGFDIIRTSNLEEFLFTLEPTGHNVTKVMPLPERNQENLRDQKLHYKERIDGFLSRAITQRRQKRERQFAARPDLQDGVFDNVTLKVVGEYLMNLVWYLDVKLALRIEISDNPKSIGGKGFMTV
ncbi:hypothetical protein PQX77_014012, partial [Marasmius sp. AFHP31]